MAAFDSRPDAATKPITSNVKVPLGPWEVAWYPGLANPVNPRSNHLVCPHEREDTAEQGDHVTHLEHRRDVAFVEPFLTYGQAEQACLVI